VSENSILKRQGGGLYFVGLKSSVYAVIAKACFIKNIGSDHFYDSKGAAISAIHESLKSVMDNLAN